MGALENTLPFFVSTENVPLARQARLASDIEGSATSWMPPKGSKKGDSPKPPPKGSCLDDSCGRLVPCRWCKGGRPNQCIHPDCPAQVAKRGRQDDEDDRLPAPTPGLKRSERSGTEVIRMQPGESEYGPPADSFRLRDWSRRSISKKVFKTGTPMPALTTTGGSLAIPNVLYQAPCRCKLDSASEAKKGNVLPMAPCRCKLLSCNGEYCCHDRRKRNGCDDCGIASRRPKCSKHGR